ncbi:hypothetical protein OOJ91_18640 [Micromonospora lupini]|uniref:hypothetical protein n=1 Tax=Micromonospora lupini TaxID=285679 RepID=UPI00224F3470|nr:hypothetical protein [Micromonospora lupini]MCX5067861.1 hypothetical protein [Micromonospora lupini]
MPAAPGPTFRAGDLLRLSATASVQFLRPITVRVIRELEWDTYDGWVWLDAYELGARGDAVARRELYVRREGVQLLDAYAPAREPAYAR